MLVSILAFLIPPVGMVGGLSLGFLVPLFLLSSLYYLKGNIAFPLLSIIKHHRLTIIFLLWMLLSCLWSFKPVWSFISFIKIFALIALNYLVLFNINALRNHFSQIHKLLIAGIIWALLLFYLEFFFHGLINSTFRVWVQKKPAISFYLHFLDRGCSLIALLSWVIITYLTVNRNYLYAFGFYLLIAVTLFISDNLAAFIGFLSGGLIFIIARYSFLGNPRILSITLIFGIVWMLGTALFLNPYKLANGMDFLPFSAKHRLFIWHYVAEKSMSPMNLYGVIYGIGNSSSRYFPVSESEMINYAGHKLSPLPLHPHNSVLQILFEQGMMGLIIYLILLYQYLNYLGKDYLGKNYQNIYPLNTSCQERVGSNKKMNRPVILPNSLYNNSLTGSLPDSYNSYNIITSGKYACFINYLIISLISYDLWQSWWLSCALWVMTIFIWVNPDTPALDN